MNCLKIVALSMVLLLGVGARLGDGVEGTKWTIKLEPSEEARGSGAKTFDETLIFKGSMFTTVQLAKKGFGPVQYEDDTRRFGPATFKATSESEKEGKAEWTGTVTSTVINGQLIWTKKDGTAVTYTYQGDKVQN